MERDLTSMMKVYQVVTLTKTYRSMTFSIRHFLAVTAFIAIVLGGLLWLSRLFGIDPKSECIVVLGEEQPLQWQDIDWLPDTTGVAMEHQDFTGSQLTALIDPVRLHESLIDLSYTDYLGNPCYMARVIVRGMRSEDWTEYSLMPDLVGGGIVDGATRGIATWDHSNRILEIELTQYRNSAKRAKTTKIAFHFDGDRLVKWDSSK